MRKNLRIFAFLAALLSLLTVLCASVTASAAEGTGETEYYIGTTVNAGHDTGYSENDKLSQEDPHFGWKLGSFRIDGFTRRTQNSAGDPVFLKTVGDTVTLWFTLEQDISALDGDSALTICADTNGYDEHFGIGKTDFGRGTLIIRHTDYRNHTPDPVIYTDYLAANAQKDAAVQVEIFEEGDYEVALNYEIKRENFDVFGWHPFPSYYNYRIYFRFSVRNGNCMVYPFDAVTGAELTDSTITENGFYLDLARSRYLNIDIKKEIRREGAEGLTEDVRFNKPAKDGETYTEEGIYTITASNIYTRQTTTKVIYVGTDDVLKAHVTTGRSIGDIEHQLSNGATVTEDGMLLSASGEILPPVEWTAPEGTLPFVEEPVREDPGQETEGREKSPSRKLGIFLAGGAVLLGILAVILLIAKRSGHSRSRFRRGR